MRLQTELNFENFPEILNSFLSIVGYKTIENRARMLIQQFKGNELLKDYIARKYWLELELFSLLEY